MALTVAETCCLRLLKLCASPGNKVARQEFRNMQDASGNYYSELFSNLKEKRIIRCKADTIEIIT
jgi:hypothetical protein